MRRRSLRWRKASFCASGECVELARHGRRILMRSSSVRRPVRLSPQAFAGLAAMIKAGQLDDLTEG